MGIIYLLTLPWLLSCGTSTFKNLEKEDPAVDGTIALEQNDPEAAIAILEPAVEKDPTDYQLVSLLASAKAALVGVDFVRVILKLATPDEDSGSESATSSATTDSEGNDVTALFSALPEPTDEAFAGLDEALALLESIPDAERLDADRYKLTVFHTSRLGLTTKAFDKDGDGQVTPVELIDLDDADATDILSSLSAAEAAINSTGDGSDSTSESASKISGISAAIEAQDGETDAEKIRNYLGGS